MRDFWIGARYSLIALLIGFAGLYWCGLGMPGRSFEGPLPAATKDETDAAARLRRHEKLARITKGVERVAREMAE